MSEKTYTPEEAAVLVLKKTEEMFKKSNLYKSNTSHEVEGGEEPHNEDSECPAYLAEADIESGSSTGKHGEAGSNISAPTDELGEGSEEDSEMEYDEEGNPKKKKPKHEEGMDEETKELHDSTEDESDEEELEQDEDAEATERDEADSDDIEDQEEGKENPFKKAEKLNGFMQKMEMKKSGRGLGHNLSLKGKKAVRSKNYKENRRGGDIRGVAKPSGYAHDDKDRQGKVATGESERGNVARFGAANTKGKKGLGRLKAKYDDFKSGDNHSDAREKSRTNVKNTMSEKGKKPNLPKSENVKTDMKKMKNAKVEKFLGLGGTKTSGQMGGISQGRPAKPAPGQSIADKINFGGKKPQQKAPQAPSTKPSISRPTPPKVNGGY